MALTFRLDKDAKGEWRWGLFGVNNKEIATSGEGYKNYGDCLHAVGLIQSGAAGAIIIDYTKSPPALVRTGGGS